MNSKLYPLFGTRLKSTACGILLAAAAIGASAQDASIDAAAKAELDSIRTEFVQISQDLKQAHQKAMASAEVLANRDALNQALKAEMIKLAGEAEKAAIEKRFELMSAIDHFSGSDEAKRNALIEQLQPLLQAQKAFEQQANQAGSVKSLQTNLIGSIQSAMAKINPEVPALMQRQQELAQKAQAIQQKAKAAQ